MSGPTSSTRSPRNRCTTAGFTQTRARSTARRSSGNCSTPPGSPLFCAEEPVASVAEPGQDIAGRIQTAVESRGDDPNIREDRVHLFDPFGRGDEADEFDRARRELL